MRCAVPETVTVEKTAKLCVVCGEPVPSGRGNRKYCEEHAPEPGRSVAQSQKTTKAPSTGRSVSTSEKAIGDTYAKLLILVSLIVIRVEIRRRNILDQGGGLADHLTFTDQEAAAFAAPIARFTHSNATATRIVGPLVQNNDLVVAAFAAYDYWNRVSAALDVARSNGAGNVRREPPRPVAPQAAEAVRTADEAINEPPPVAPQNQPAPPPTVPPPGFVPQFFDAGGDV
jgi:hypothetical protein